MAQGTYRFGFLLLCSLTSATCAIKASAHETSFHFTGPLLTLNAANLSAGAWSTKPYLMYYGSDAHYAHNGKLRKRSADMRQWQALLPVTVGITDHLQLQGTISGVHTASRGTHSDGISVTDSTLGMQYMLLSPRNDRQRRALSVAFAHRFPTGAYDRAEQNPLNAVGGGTDVNTFTVLLQQYVPVPNDHSMRFRTTASYSPPPDRARVTGMSTYGTPRGFRGLVRLGNALKLSAAVEYSLGPHWALAMEAIYSRDGVSQLNGTVVRNGEVKPFARRDASRNVVSVAPAIEYSFNNRIGVIGGAQVSVAGHNSSAFVTPMTAISIAM